MGYQEGHFYKAFNAWHLRYYTTKAGVRVQRSRRICDGSHSKSEAKRLASPFLAEINAETSTNAPVEQHQSVADFWTSTYLPWATENLRASTVWGNRQLWSQHLKPHFGDRTLREYHTSDGSRFLDELPKQLSKATVQHVRSLASGIFSYALNRGLIDSNPWSAVKTYQKRRGTGDTPVYRLEEAENIITALVERVDCQLIVALAFFVGLRPGEIGALRWEDFSDGYVHIRRAMGRGVVAEPKTQNSIASLPLIAPVKVPLELWRVSCGRPSEGWVFSNKAGKPLDLKSLTHRVIVPTLEAKKITWKGLYAGRRGAATILTELTGDALAAKELLRHRSIVTTGNHYVKAIPEALLKGIKLLEAKAAK